VKRRPDPLAVGLAFAAAVGLLDVWLLRGWLRR
jgi:hypothetical protein